MIAVFGICLIRCVVKPRYREPYPSSRTSKESVWKKDLYFVPSSLSLVRTTSVQRKPVKKKEKMSGYFHHFSLFFPATNQWFLHENPPPQVLNLTTPLLKKEEKDKQSSKPSICKNRMSYIFGSIRYLTKQGKLICSATIQKRTVARAYILAPMLTLVQHSVH